MSEQQAFPWASTDGRTEHGDPDTAAPILQFSSGGNDSVALTQWLHEQGYRDVRVMFSDTGWGSTDWPARIDRVEAWCATLGYSFVRTESVGMEALTRSKKGWPMNGLQWCTLTLKIKPAWDWLEANDPGKELVCAVGVRRQESKRRENYPRFTPESASHGDRALFAPLVEYGQRQRDQLLQRAGWEPLPHSSNECFPCINANRADLRRLSEDEAKVSRIEAIEESLGMTSRGKPRVMFRPYKHKGAVGIRETIRWAWSERGRFVPVSECTGPTLFDLDFDAPDKCAEGWCGI